MKFSIFRIKKTVQYREVSVLPMGRLAQVSTLWRYLHYRGKNCMYLWDQKTVLIARCLYYGRGDTPESHVIKLPAL